ncbi:hypothetical protein GCM10027075_46530 [Streptomyces heilongjiangensis]
MMAQLAIHCAEAATPRAAARMRSGNISPGNTHTTTPQDRAELALAPDFRSFTERLASARDVDSAHAEETPD